MRHANTDGRHAYLAGVYDTEYSLASLAEQWVVTGSGVANPDVAAHIARYDALRTMREIAAKRRRLQRHCPVQRLAVPHYLCEFDGQQWPCPDIRDDLDVAYVGARPASTHPQPTLDPERCGGNRCRQLRA